MKPLILFFMAFAATNAFFLSDQARKDFYQEMERIFSIPHKFIMHGDVRIPLEPLKMSELMRAVEKFQALSEVERGAIINHLFGEKFPRPVPASHMSSTHTYDEEKLKEIHEKWEAMTPEEREEVRNNRRKDSEFLKPDFIQRYPRDMLEHHNFKDLDEQKLKEIHDKWEAMTPEERKEIFRKEHGEIRSRSKRSLQAIRPLPEFINDRYYPGDIPNARPIPERPIARPEDDIGRPTHWNSRPFPKPEKPVDWHTVSLPDVDRVLYPMDGNFQPIKPLDKLKTPIFNSVDWIARPFPQPIAQPGETINPIIWFARPAPLPEVDRVLYPIDGNFQPIKPLQELENSMIQPASDNGRTRPVDPVARDRMPQPIKPLPIRKASTTLFDEMTDEERLQVIRELFPEGLPIRPIGPIPIIPAEKDNSLVFKHEYNENDDTETGEIEDYSHNARRPIPIIPAEKDALVSEHDDTETRNIEDYPHRNRRPRSFQPILPLKRQPILPNQFQPIMPLKSQPILPLQRQPILPLQRQPILPIKSQPILPNQFQPIMPL